MNFHHSFLVLGLLPICLGVSPISSSLIIASLPVFFVVVVEFVIAVVPVVVVDVVDLVNSLAPSGAPSIPGASDLKSYRHVISDKFSLFLAQKRTHNFLDKVQDFLGLNLGVNCGGGLVWQATLIA